MIELQALRTDKTEIDTVELFRKLLNNPKEIGLIREFCIDQGFEAVEYVIGTSSLGYLVYDFTYDWTNAIKVSKYLQGEEKIPLVESPEDYIRPSDLLENGLMIDNIFSIQVEERVYTHPNEAYTYNTKELLESFVRFLHYKIPELNFCVFPNAVEKKDSVKVQSLILKNYITNGFPYLKVELQDAKLYHKRERPNPLSEAELETLSGYFKGIIKDIKLHQAYSEIFNDYVIQAVPNHLLTTEGVVPRLFEASNFGKRQGVACHICGSDKIDYSEDFDSEYCSSCDNWLIPKCNDKACEYCNGRPLKPSELE